MTIIQRLGGALNLNIHVHALVIDGVFVREDGRLRFQPAGRLTRDDVAEVVAVVARCIARYGSPPEDAAPMRVGPCHANVEGFDLHAGILVPAGDRVRLERLCRYALRPPGAQTRLRVDAEGQAGVPAARTVRGGVEVWLSLRHPWADGTTHLRFEPVAFLARLAVLIPPRINLVLYHGVLAPRAAWRAAVVASAGSEWSDAPDRVSAADDGTDGAIRHRRGYLWAELMRRTFGIDVLACPQCGGRLRLLAVIEHAPIVARMLEHLGLPTERPEPRPARAPPGLVVDEDSQLRAETDATC